MSGIGKRGGETGAVAKRRGAAQALERAIERRVIEAICALARHRHGKRCGLVRVELYAEQVLLGVLDFSPENCPSAASTGPPSARSAACE